MVTFEQVKLLETKVAKAIDFVDRVAGENALLRGKLETYQKRIGELEVLIQRFKDDQSRIEEGILSALDRLSRFEAEVEQTISPVSGEAEVRRESVPAEAVAPPSPTPGENPVAAALEEETSEEDEDTASPDNIYMAEQPEEALIFDTGTEEDADLGADEITAPVDDGVDPAELDIF
ncbi:MAG: cell division protein ZapB [Treponema sp.]|jgi:chromosome segregation ATPase|nr:cell division protein ZapB [Treponema sp.]